MIEIIPKPLLNKPYRFAVVRIGINAGVVAMAKRKQCAQSIARQYALADINGVYVAEDMQPGEHDEGRKHYAVCVKVPPELNEIGDEIAPAVLQFTIARRHPWYGWQTRILGEWSTTQP